MKKLSICTILLCSFLATVSCKKDNPTPEPTPQSDKLYEIVEADTIWLPNSFFDLSTQYISNYNINLNDIQYDGLDVSTVLNSVTSNWESGIITCNMNYKSKDISGNPDMHSGRIYVKNEPGKKLKGVIMAHHFTNPADEECPSRRIFQIDAIYSVFGYAVVMADYIGYGKTVDVPHPYLDWKSTAQTCIDAYYAIKQYLEDNDYEVGGELYNIGYSQGGATGMAVLRLATEQYPDIQFTKSYLGGGIYDIEATFNDILEKNYTGIPYAMPMIVNGLNFSNDLGINLDDVFIGITRDNYRKVLSKEYTADSLNKILTDHQASKIFSEFMFDEIQPITTKIMEAARKNNLVNTWTPRPGEKIFLLHSTVDDYVPFVNSQLMDEALRNSGCDYQCLFDDYVGHVPGAIVHYLNILSELLNE